MRRKNEEPCITFHLNPARRSPNPARRSPKPRADRAENPAHPGPANQKSRRVPAYFSALISSPSTGSNFTPYQWSGSSRVFLMQVRV